MLFRSNSFSITVSEDLEPDTVNQANPFVASHDGHFYTLTDTTYNWNDAEAYAQGLGGDLVTINDAAEQAFVSKWFRSEERRVGKEGRSRGAPEGGKIRREREESVREIVLLLFLLILNTYR